MSRAAVRGLSHSEEDRAFLQRRVALFGLLIGSGYLLFLLYRIAGMLVSGATEEFSHPAFWWHVVAFLCFFSLWLVCRGGQRSSRFVRLAELFAMTSGVLATGAMAMFISPENRPDFVALLVLSNVVLGRSILVPSSGPRTAALGLVVGLVLLASVRSGSLVELSVWWTITVMLATATSVVIYGLRRRVRDAEQLGQYKLEEKLGEGGMGMVYRARHAFLRRPTAVKLLPPDKAGEDNVRRFEQEVQLTARLSHPNTITIFDYGHTADGIFYYAMEYVDGLTLTDIVDRTGPQPAGRAVHLMRQAASALAEAHGVGLVHRDIKPGNIMVHLLHPHGSEGDFVKVLDFGLVKQARHEGGVDLTDEDALAGTPQYLAPESITAPGSVDGRTDVYALGAVAYYLVTGSHVFTGQSVVEVCGHHLHTEPESPSSRLGRPLPADLEAIILRALAKKPSDRPASASELEQGLARCSGVEPWTAEHARMWWAAHGRRPARAEALAEARTIEVRLSSRDDPDRS